MKNTKSQNGFTLLELVIVLAVLAILSGVLVPMVKQMIDRAKTAKVTSLIDTIEAACKRYYKDNRQFAIENPTGGATADFHRLAYAPDGTGGYTTTSCPNWSGPYLNEPLQNTQLPFQGGTIAVVSANYGGGAGYRLAGAAGPLSEGWIQEIQLVNVPDLWRIAIETTYDGVASDGVNGKVRWTDTGDDINNMWIFLFTR